MMRTQVRIIMNSDTEKKIDQLLHYLPLFSDKNFKWIESRSPREPDENGIYPFPSISYKEEVLTFFRILSDPFWLDRNYLNSNAREILNSEGKISQCTFEQIRALLTYCNRGERFCTGHWNTLFESGKITRILLRLKELKDQGKIR